MDTQPKRQELMRPELSGQADVEIIQPGQVVIPDDLAELIGDAGGRGISEDAADSIIPLVYILQNNSPQVTPRNPKQIEGACAGDFYLKDSGLPAIPGDHGMVVQSCHFHKGWVEWLPERGGYVTQHQDRPPESKETIRIVEGRDKKFWEMPNGNIVVETRYHYLLFQGRPFVLPLSSTGHTASRVWMALMNGFRYPSGKKADGWSRKYLLTTVPVTKAQFNWFSLKVQDLGWVSGDEFKTGQSLYESIISGEKVAATEEASREPGQDDPPF